MGEEAVRWSISVSKETDDVFLAVSEAGRADYLVTGDKRGLLTLREHCGTKIVSPRRFVEILER